MIDEKKAILKTELLDSFLEALTTKKIQHEVHPHEVTDGKLIGITYGKGTWHWFVWFPLKQTGKEYIRFNHSYSQINGKTKKGYRHARNVCHSLIGKIGTQFNHIL